MCLGLSYIQQNNFNWITFIKKHRIVNENVTEEYKYN